MQEKGTKKKKANNNVFESEYTNLKRVTTFLKEHSEEIDIDNKFRQELVTLSKSYKETLDESRLITKVSDRLQRKVETAKQKLEESNIELQETVDALTKARVGRKAATIVLIIAVILFLVVEGVLEPIIDDWVAQNFDASYTTPFSLGVKLILALLLRPIEMVVEKALMRNTAKKKVNELKEAKFVKKEPKVEGK
ncbi:MAG: hypothetical protein GY827_00305 [Cytophagales bacterium]|nr:hypothetical protein [Cytophagales bacterium]